MCEGVIRQTGSQHSLRDGGGRGPVRPGRSSHTCSLPSASPDLRPSSALVVSSKIHVKPNTYTEYIKHRVASGLRADETGGKTSTCCSKKERRGNVCIEGWRHEAAAPTETNRGSQLKVPISLCITITHSTFSCSLRH